MIISIIATIIVFRINTTSYISHYQILISSTNIIFIILIVITTTTTMNIIV